MPVDFEESVSIAPGSSRLDLPEQTGRKASDSYVAPATGESFTPFQFVSPRSTTRTNGKKAKTSKGQPLAIVSGEIGRALRRHWTEAEESADSMRRAAEAADLMGVGIAADQFEQNLVELWKLREFRDINWQTILNHMQGLMRMFFLGKRAETITVEQCTRIHNLVKDYLGPATKTIEDLNEVIRLIEDSGFDPYAAISGDPSFEPDREKNK